MAQKIQAFGGAGLPACPAREARLRRVGKPGGPPHHTFAAALVLAAALAVPALSQKTGSPFVGRWDFTIAQLRASWLGVTEKNGALDVWYQPTGGNVYQVKDFKVQGNRLILTFAASGKRTVATWELQPDGDKLTGLEKRGPATTPLTGVRSPELKRNAPRAWTDPQPLFNGRNLDGWEPIGNAADSHWVVKDGLLVNQEHGANLKSTRTFDDFKVHFEVNCPDGGNSGFYLRGRYEMQIEYEPLSLNPVERRIGSIYGRIAPKELPRTPGAWETFDIALVGRTVTIARNGTTTIDHREIEGITGGALDAHEGEPGPFYIQGDHTGGLKFRNITVSLPRP